MPISPLRQRPVDSTDFAEATRDLSAEETFNQLLGAVA